MMFKTKGLDRVTERLFGLMVIITLGPVATSVFEYLLGFKALDFSNWENELSLQICKRSCIFYPVLPPNAPFYGGERETSSHVHRCSLDLALKLAGFYFQ